ncbi:MAG: AAC(3) family N-acetyltransferase [Oscillospiraceae bacterium]
MYTKSELMNDMQKLGLVASDTILVHSSLKSVGEVENGADGVLDAFCEYLSSGLLVMPGHTWSYINAENPMFDLLESPTCVGVLTELFRKRKDVYRSLHPTHSLLAYGHGAKQFVIGQEQFATPCAPDSCYGMLEKMDGKVVLVGVDFSRCTLVHCVEEVAKITGRLTDTQEQLSIKKEDGEIIAVPSYRHQNANSSYYVKLQPVLEDRNVLIKGKLGDADVLVCKMKDLFRICLELLKKNPRLFDDDASIPNVWF